MCIGIWKRGIHSSAAISYQQPRLTPCPDGSRELQIQGDSKVSSHLTPESGTDCMGPWGRTGQCGRRNLQGGGAAAMATMRTVPRFSAPPEMPRCPGFQGTAAVELANPKPRSINGWLDQKSSPSSCLPRALPLTSFFPNLLPPSRSSVKHLLGSAGAVVIFGGSPPCNGRVFSLFFCRFPPAPSSRRRQYASVLFVAVSSPAPPSSKHSHGLSLLSCAFCTAAFLSLVFSLAPSIGRRLLQAALCSSSFSSAKRHCGPDRGTVL